MYFTTFSLIYYHDQESWVLFLVSHRIFEWNSLEADLVTLYNNLTDLGMEYHDGEVHLIDLELEEQQDV